MTKMILARSLQSLRQASQGCSQRSVHTAATAQVNRAALPLHRRQAVRSAASATAGISLKGAQQSRCISVTPARRAKQLPPRSEKFKKITKEDIAAFKEITSGVMSTVEGANTASQDELVPFNEDWM